MLDLLFSLQFIWIFLLISLLSIGLAFLCAFLQRQFLYIAIGDWLMQHIYCPVFRVLMLMFMAFLIFPLIVQSVGYSELSRLFIQPDFLINMVNVLFISSLLLSFLPGLGHPGFAMPLLGCIATGLIFLHKMGLERGMEFQWLPPFAASMKIFLIMLISYIVSRWLTRHLSEYIDNRFIISESKVVIADINHLIFQIPVVLAYGNSLYLQTLISSDY